MVKIKYKLFGFSFIFAYHKYNEKTCSTFYRFTNFPALQPNYNSIIKFFSYHIWSTWYVKREKVLYWTGKSLCLWCMSKNSKQAWKNFRLAVWIWSKFDKFYIINNTKKYIQLDNEQNKNSQLKIQYQNSKFKMQN